MGTGAASTHVCGIIYLFIYFEDSMSKNQDLNEYLKRFNIWLHKKKFSPKKMI
jgi:hypothetical protein